MREEKPRFRRELTHAIFNGVLERELGSSVSLRQNGDEDLLDPDPHYQPGKKSRNNTQNDS
jgi:hypothetical protein